MTTRGRSLLAGLILSGAVVAALIVFAINRDSGTAASPAGDSSPVTNRGFESESGPLSLTSLRGQPVALAFVQAGCGSCAASLKAFSNIAAKMPDAHFVALNMPGGGSAAALADFTDSLGATGITSAAYSSNDISKQFDITSLDTILVLDADGKIVWRAVRPTQADIEQALQAASA